MSHRTTPVLPALTGAISLRALQNYLAPLHDQNYNAGFGVCQYTHGFGTAIASGAYTGGAYSPTQNRIYLVPYSVATSSSWYYLDCSTGALLTYAVTALTGNCIGAVYGASQDTLYFIPASQAATGSWPRLHCRTGQTSTYSAGVTPLSFAGGAYAPVQDRVYLSPYAQSDQATWYYVNGATGAVVGYTNNSGVTPSSSGYFGATYSPTQDRIYLIPYAQYSQANWHYIDCASGNVVAYAHGATVTGSYLGGVFSPMQNRIYLMPRGQAAFSTWHYIDCSNGSVVPYTGASGLGANAYYGGAYSPATNRIYLCPSAQAAVAVWHYIDCSSGSVVAYTHGYGTSLADSSYAGMVFSPTQGRVYLIPYLQSALANWHYIQEYAPAEIPPSIAALAMFNKL